MRKLKDARWFDGIYSKIYEILNVENRMPPLDEVYLLDEPDLKEFGFKVRNTTHGLASPDRCNSRKNYVWFRQEPPPPLFFAHEMIHLARKRKPLNDEVYAYNLSPLIVMLAEKGYVPKRNPLRLLEDVDLKTIEKAVKKYFPIESIEEFFSVKGVIPQFMTLDKEARKKLTDEDVVIASVAELVSMAENDERVFEMLMELIERNEREERNNTKNVVANY